MIKEQSLFQNHSSKESSLIRTQSAKNPLADPSPDAHPHPKSSAAKELLLNYKLDPVTPQLQQLPSVFLIQSNLLITARKTLLSRAWSWP